MEGTLHDGAVGRGQLCARFQGAFGSHPVHSCWDASGAHAGGYLRLAGPLSGATLLVLPQGNSGFRAYVGVPRYSEYMQLHFSG